MIFISGSKAPYVVKRGDPYTNSGAELGRYRAFAKAKEQLRAERLPDEAIARVTHVKGRFIVCSMQP